ncbi:MAG TPA: TlpA disulfide reductase family protein [Streptosporangiaceae bacterium]|nr:TlpA disulfide reductase family protein [Streptosporangiaceae bacterium]
MTAADAGPPTGGTARRLAHRLRGLGAARLTALTAVLVGVAVIVTLSLTGTGGGPHQAPPAPAKSFSLGALGHPGQRITLSSLAGRPVIVNFFASWCTPCQKETPMLARFARHTSVAVVGIDVNDPTSSALAFVHKTGVTYPVATESAMGRTVINYNLPGLPATFFLDSRHRIVKRVYGAVSQAELTTGAALISGRAGRG